MYIHLCDLTDEKQQGTQKKGKGKSKSTERAVEVHKERRHQDYQVSSKMGENKEKAAVCTPTNV